MVLALGYSGVSKNCLLIRGCWVQRFNCTWLRSRGKDIETAFLDSLRNPFRYHLWICRCRPPLGPCWLCSWFACFLLPLPCYNLSLWTPWLVIFFCKLCHSAFLEPLISIPDSCRPVLSTFTGGTSYWDSSGAKSLVWKEIVWAAGAAGHIFESLDSESKWRKRDGISMDRQGFV